MKKFLKYNILLIILLVVFSLPTVVYGQECPTAGQLRNQETGECYTPVGSGGFGGFQSGIAEDETTTDSALEAAGTTSFGTGGTSSSGPTAPGGTATPSTCSFTNFSSSIKTCVLLPVVNFVLDIVSIALYLAGKLFNLAVEFNLNISRHASSFGVEKAWVVLRNLVNIGFIFVLLWIAIQQILGLSESKRLLTSIIIAALLINFSLFFTKIIIDTSNIFAQQFYQAITAGSPGDISAQFMDRLKLQGIYAYGTAGQALETGTLAMLSTMIFGSILIIIAAAIFFLASLMFIARAAMLLFLMATSPVGFIGTWVPKLGQYADMWWKELINQSIFAPIFLLLIWVVLKITEPVSNSLLAGSLFGSGGNVSFATVLSGSSSGAPGVVLNYLIVIAFLIAALNAARGLSGTAGAKLSGIGQKAFGAVAGGAGGFALRQTVGRGAAWIAERDTFKRLASAKDAQGNPTLGARFGMLGLRGVEGVAKSSFDVRGARIPGATDALSAVGGGVDFGRASGVGGFRKAEQAAIDDRSKARADQAKILEFKESPDQEKARREAFEGARSRGEVTGEFKTSKEITAERQRSFAQQLRTPLKMAGITITRPFTSSVEGDIKAAVDIEKSGKKTGDEAKTARDLIKNKEKLKAILNEALTKDGVGEKIKTDDDITLENIELAKKEFEKREAEATVKEKQTLDETERVNLIIKLAQAKRKSQEIKEHQGEMERLQGRLDQLRGVSAPSGSEKKEENKTT